MAKKSLYRTHPYRVTILKPLTDTIRFSDGTTQVLSVDIGPRCFRNEKEARAYAAGTRKDHGADACTDAYRA